MLRKAMGKKKADVMAKRRRSSSTAPRRAACRREKAAELWDYIEPFAGYGFNKSHSVAYAMLAYQTAYLKAHYPVAFMAAMLNSELDSTDAIAKYIAECRDMGIDAAAAGHQRERLRLHRGRRHDPLRPRRRQGGGGGRDRGRARGPPPVGRFRSLAHLATEVDLRRVNRKVFECLIKAGAFDSLGVAPRRALAVARRHPRLRPAPRREREEGQDSLFGALVGAGELDASPRPTSGHARGRERERLRYEKEALGFFLTGNPLSEHQAPWSGWSRHTTALARREGAPEGHGHARRHGGRLQPGEDQERRQRRPLHGPLRAGGPRGGPAGDPLRQPARAVRPPAAPTRPWSWSRARCASAASEVEITVEEIVPVNKLAARPSPGSTWS